MHNIRFGFQSLQFVLRIFLVIISLNFISGVPAKADTVTIDFTQSPNGNYGNAADAGYSGIPVTPPFPGPAVPGLTYNFVVIYSCNAATSSCGLTTPGAGGFDISFDPSIISISGFQATIFAANSSWVGKGQYIDGIITESLDGTINYLGPFQVLLGGGTSQMGPVNLPAPIRLLQAPEYPFLYTSITLTYTLVQNTKLSIASPTFWQVIKNPQLPMNDSNVIDAVQDKSASFGVFLVGAPGTILPLSGKGTVKITGPDSSAPSTAIFDFSDFPADGSPYEIKQNMFSPSYIPKTEGQQTITATISGSPSIAPVTQTIMQLYVHKTYAPSIGLVAIKQPDGANCSTPTGEGCIGTPTGGNMAKLYDAIGPMSKMYPVKDNSISFIPNDSTKIPAISGSNSHCLVPFFSKLCYKFSLKYGGLAQDALKLAQLKTQDNALFNRIVGIVSPEYFYNRVLDNWDGVWLPSYPGVVFAKASNAPDDPETILHELAHSFGQNLEAYCSGASGINGACPAGSPVASYDGTTVNGYDATSSSCYQYPLADDACTLAESIMNADSDISVVNSWMDDNTYSKVFNALSQPIADPDVFVISGILDSSGQFTFSSSFEVPNGVLTPDAPNGDLTISTLDANNNLINSVTLQSDFTAIATLAKGAGSNSPIIQLDAIPVLVSLPTSPNIESIQVTSKNGGIVTKISASSQLLQGIVSDIPDNAFKERVRDKDRAHDHDRNTFAPATTAQIAKDRDILLKNVSSIQNFLESKHSKEAIEYLSKLIDQIKRMTFSDYTVSNAAQMTQLQVIQGIESIITKIKNTDDQDSHSNKHEGGK